ncbi:hypothetical protein [Nocardioides jishulii]|uniref:Uncharacterized protein n=1 Tax=Nocardioides jishulii TaxID=2575440 RepID=A0A4U2YSA3_9ACTN|nr:hypothetical protein [Nocardioides jishulii]QCX28795.1 hypothetical protein FCL41_15605 [Nocardioides jishulii]TKI64309.1 hypothetical protein FC770_03965 [Nocardioides jishulii]
MTLGRGAVWSGSPHVRNEAREHTLSIGQLEPVEHRMHHARGLLASSLRHPDRSGAPRSPP